MILCIGEILADLILNADTGDIQSFVGGAPFNVAVGAARCDAEVTFLGRVGDDPMGDYIRAKAAPFPLKTVIQIDKNRPTTLAIVSINGEGERSFRFVRENAADYHIRVSEKFLSSRRIDLLHIGSLMLSTPCGRKTAGSLLRYAKEKNVPVSFDVNYRDDIFGSAEKAFACYEPLIKGADIVKFSDDELALYLGKPVLEGIRELKNPIVCVTLGKEGCLVKKGEDVIAVPSVPVRPVDTTGAGDAFFGAFLAGVDEVGFSALTSEDIRKIAGRANKKGAEATLHKGAV